MDTAGAYAVPGSLPTMLLLLAVLASYRLTRLVNADVILDRPRSWFYAHAPQFLAEMVSCPFCIGFWISAAVGLGTYYEVIPEAVLWALGVAGATSLIYEYLSRGD